MISYGTQRYYNLKDKCFEKLGKACIKCGFNDIRILQFDHVNGCGKEKRVKGANSRLTHILDNPDLYQVLCPNCNFMKKLERREFGNRWGKDYQPKLMAISNQINNR